jgi:hypothetical protein
MSFGKAPKPPDPYAQADAQTQSNQDTATYNNAITHGNTYTPLGNNTYTGRVDPTTGATVYDQTVTLDPAQQALLDVQNQQDLALGQTGNKLLGQVDNAIGNPVSDSGLPQLQGSVNPGGPGIQGKIDTNGLPQLYGADDLLGARQQVSDALYSQQSAYLDPQYANQDQQLRTELANKGVAEGSEAWNRMQGDFNRNKSFDYARAREAAITGSGTEMQRLSDMALANRGQIYGERATSAGFQNDAQAQALAQALTQAQFGNQTRAQGLDERYAARAQPLNELSALRGSTQVNVPQFAAAQNSTTDPADIGGYIGQNYQNQLAAWKQKQANVGGVMSGLFGLGSAALGA